MTCMPNFIQKSNFLHEALLIPLESNMKSDKICGKSFVLINAMIFVFSGKNIPSWDPLVSSFRLLRCLHHARGRPVRNKWLAHFIRLSNPTSRFLGTPTGRNTNRPTDQQTHQQVRTEEHLHPNTAFMQLYYRSYHRWYQEMHERANCNLIENNIVQTYFKAFLIPARIAKSKVARVWAGNNKANSEINCWLYGSLNVPAPISF